MSPLRESESAGNGAESPYTVTLVEEHPDRWRLIVSGGSTQLADPFVGIYPHITMEGAEYNLISRSWLYLPGWG